MHKTENNSIVNSHT